MPRSVAKTPKPVASQNNNNTSYPFITSGVPSTQFLTNTPHLPVSYFYML